MSERDDLEGRAPPPDISALLASVLSNPNAAAMLSSLLGGIQSAPPPPETPKKSEAEESIPTLFPIADAGERHSGRRDERDRALLCALKPYLSRPRCELVDRLIGILSVIELAGPLLGIDLGKPKPRNK